MYLNLPYQAVPHVIINNIKILLQLASSSTSSIKPGNKWKKNNCIDKVNLFIN